MARFTLPREFYIPKGSVRVSQRNGDSIVYLYETTGSRKQYGVVAFHGTRSSKPDFNYTYSSPKQRENKVSEFFQIRQKIKPTIRNNHKNSHVNVGDVYVSTWGYDQTNVDFYVVVVKVGTSSVKIKKIPIRTVNDTAYMSRTVEPNLDVDFDSEVMLRRVSNDSIRIDDVRTAFVWDGNPVLETSYS